MKYLGIVGTSHLSEIEEMDVRKTIPYLVEKFKIENPFDEIGIITGDANGVDKLVWEYVKQFPKLYKNSRRYEAHVKTWKYFKERNIGIATASDKVISITTKIKNQRCYHCKQDHQRTGGCFTARWCKGLYKPVEVIVI